MVLCGIEGGAWYLGERVSVQSFSASNFLVPKKPPATMLSKDNAYPIRHHWTKRGKSAMKFLLQRSENQYPKFLAKFLRHRGAHLVDQVCYLTCTYFPHFYNLQIFYYLNKANVYNNFYTKFPSQILSSLGKPQL